MHNFSRTLLARTMFWTTASIPAPVFAATADIAKSFPDKPVRFIVPRSAHIKSEIAKWRKFAQDSHLVLNQ